MQNYIALALRIFSIAVSIIGVYFLILVLIRYAQGSILDTSAYGGMATPFFLAGLMAEQLRSSSLKR